MERGIMGGFANTGLGLRADTRTQHHVPEIGPTAAKGKPRNGVPGGASSC
jgi:hypothetical protein